MKRIITTTVIILLFSFSLSSQNKKEKKTQVRQVKKAEKQVIKNIPVQSLYSNLFNINKIYFNKRIDYTGKGEILEVEFRLNNIIDDPHDLYIFVIATDEIEEKIVESSFKMPVPPQKKLRSFVPFPDDIKNFEYPDPDNKGKTSLKKEPKDPQAGVDPKTGKPYHLSDSIFVRTYHLSKYRNNYYFFNGVILLIYDKDGKPLFRQKYRFSGIRR